MNAISPWLGSVPFATTRSDITPSPRFGKNKERFSEENLRLERQLLDAGANRQTMRDQWNIILWAIRDRGGKIRLRIEKLGKFDEAAFKEWFYGVIGRRPELDIRYQEVKRCCGKQCDGCLNGNKSHRKTWIG